MSGSKGVGRKDILQEESYLKNVRNADFVGEIPKRVWEHAKEEGGKRRNRPHRSKFHSGLRRKGSWPSRGLESKHDAQGDKSPPLLRKREGDLEAESLGELNRFPG